MKENILYAYHMKIDEIEEEKDYAFFSYQNNSYYFTKIKRNEKEFQELLAIIQELRKKNIPIFPFVLNYYGSYVTMVENIPYVLVEVTQPQKEYGILEMMEFQKLLVLTNEKSSLYRNEWASLWAEKVDYFEYQVHEMGKKYPIILNTFSYYVGLAENAISYAKLVEKRIPKPQNLPIVLSHRRVSYPNYRLNYDNPLNFIFDLEVRDIASYIKSMFFEDEDLAIIDLETFVKLRKPDLYSLSMLYARLLYPSYYFDAHVKIMEYKEKETILLSLIDKIDAYEKFLQKVWYMLRKYAPLEPIAWLLKKESQ